VKTVNSISGGKTSAYIAVNYPADYNVFALVRTDDKSCLFPDAKLRQMVSDRIGVEFIGTLEMDEIIYTIFDLEQYIGREIVWVTGKSFDEIIKRGDKIYLPNKAQRFCTIEMKLKPIQEWWYKTINEVVDMRIGYRANEMRRSKSMIARLRDGVEYDKFVVGKKNNRNKWKELAWRVPSFPLIIDGVFKDNIEEYWKEKQVRFAYMNNCVGCFHRSPILLKHLSNTNENKFNWFMNTETDVAQFKTEVSYRDIKDSLNQTTLFDEDFNECDSGYCGL
jgi:hypothetical protein